MYKIKINITFDIKKSYLRIFLQNVRGIFYLSTIIDYIYIYYI